MRMRKPQTDNFQKKIEKRTEKKQTQNEFECLIRFCRVL